MTSGKLRREGFPKSSRLLKSREFKFTKYRRFQSEWFGFVYQFGGKGRLGVSISKKILRNAAARNRVRRLIRESFRVLKAKPNSPLLHVDLHVVALPPLQTAWRTLKLADMAAQFEQWYRKALPSLSLASKDGEGSRHEPKP